LKGLQAHIFLRNNCNKTFYYLLMFCFILSAFSSSYGKVAHFSKNAKH
jgi:hypothetical protein